MPQEGTDQGGEHHHPGVAGAVAAGRRAKTARPGHEVSLARHQRGQNPVHVAAAILTIGVGSHDERGPPLPGQVVTEAKGGTLAAVDRDVANEGPGCFGGLSGGVAGTVDHHDDFGPQVAELRRD